jgi:hypothetical protein
MRPRALTEELTLHCARLNPDRAGFGAGFESFPAVELRGERGRRRSRFRNGRSRSTSRRMRLPRVPPPETASRTRDLAAMTRDAGSLTGDPASQRRFLASLQGS